VSAPAIPGTAATPAAAGRAVLVRRGLWLNYATTGYTVVEAIVSIIAGLLAGSSPANVATKLSAITVS